MPLSDMASNTQVDCINEYGQLKSVIVCPPDHMQIKEVINETQKVYAFQNINQERAKKQHRRFIDVLKQNGTEVLEVAEQPDLNEQVFTRDTGFAIGKNLFLSNIHTGIRKEEIPVLQKTLKEEGIPFQSPFYHSIEGGDVIIDEHKVWVGESGRTSKKAIEQLDDLLPFHQVELLKFDKEILHLDCVFNIIDRDWALIYPQAFSKKDIAKLKEHYHLIEINFTEQFTMGANVLSIGNRKVISLPENIEVNKKMKENGFEIIAVEFSEIIKSGGSFRCCTLPLRRG